MFMRNKAGQDLPRWLPSDLRQMGSACLQPSHLGQASSMCGGRMRVVQGREAELLSEVNENLFAHQEQSCLGHISEEREEKYLAFLMLPPVCSRLV